MLWDVTLSNMYEYLQKNKQIQITNILRVHKHSLHDEAYDNAVTMPI